MGREEEGCWTEVRGQEPGGGAGKYFGIKERRLSGLKGVLTVTGELMGKAVVRAAKAEARANEVRIFVFV